MAKTKTLNLQGTYDFAATLVLADPLRVTEYVGHHRYLPKSVRAGVRVTVTYHAPLARMSVNDCGQTNCGVHVLRKDDNTVIDREFVATPAAVLAATGIDVTDGSHDR